MQTDDCYEVYPFLTPEESRQIPDYKAYTQVLEMALCIKSACGCPQEHRLYWAIGVKCPCCEACSNCGQTVIRVGMWRRCLHCGWTKGC